MGAKIAYYWNLYWHVLSMQLRSRMSFRLNFFVMLVGVFLREAATLALMVVLVQKFDGLAGWRTWEIAFLYSFVTLTFRNFSSFVGGIGTIPALVRTGEMDVYLLTPSDPLFLINCRNTMIWRSFYNIGIFAVTLYCAYQAGIAFTPGAVCCLAVLILCGMFILFAVYLIVYAAAIRVVEVSALLKILDGVYKQYMVYPIPIYGRVAAWIFTFLLPLGLASYYPSGVLLNRVSGLTMGWGTLAIAAAACLWVAAALLLWRASIRKYNSTGT
jgi:ABC-2 type transport system permease protein